MKLTLFEMSHFISQHYSKYKHYIHAARNIKSLLEPTRLQSWMIKKFFQENYIILSWQVEYNVRNKFCDLEIQDQSHKRFFPPCTLQSVSSLSQGGLITRLLRFSRHDRNLSLGLLVPWTLERYEIFWNIRATDNCTSFTFVRTWGPVTRGASIANSEPAARK